MKIVPNFRVSLLGFTPEVSPFSSPTQSALLGGFFVLNPREVAGAVGMWESRGFCEISKERWEEGKSCFWISTLSTTPPFP
jgi:hypothetical protein